MKTAARSRRSVRARVAQDFPSFRSLRSAIRFWRGYCVPRVIVQLAPDSFAIVSRSTARRLELKEVRS